MKILIGVDYISRKNTGISSLIENLTSHLFNKGFFSSIAAIEDNYTKEDLIKFQFSKVLLIEKSFFLLSSFRKYISFYFNSNADLGHLHSIWSISSVAMYCWSIIKKKPYILSSNGMFNDWALSQSSFKKKLFLFLLFKRIVKRAKLIIVNSKAEEDYLIKNGWHKEFCIIPNGVSVPNLDIVSKKPGKEKILLFLSRIHKKKGIDILLDAWSELHETTNNKGWGLKIVGFFHENHNFYENYILNKIDNTPSLSNVFVSEGKFGNEMWKEFFSADGFVLPTFSEGSAMVVLNAWLAGKICITTNGSNLEYGLDENCTILVETNVTSLKDGILKLIHLSDNELSDFGAIGKSIVSQNYTWDSIVDQHIKIYQNIVKRYS